LYEKEELRIKQQIHDILVEEILNNDVRVELIMSMIKDNINLIWDVIKSKGRE
jgi:hypothetical protein